MEVELHRIPSDNDDKKSQGSDEVIATLFDNLLEVSDEAKRTLWIRLGTLI